MTNNYSYSIDWRHLAALIFFAAGNLFRYWGSFAIQPTSIAIAPPNWLYLLEYAVIVSDYSRMMFKRHVYDRK